MRKFDTFDEDGFSQSGEPKGWNGWGWRWFETVIILGAIMALIGEFTGLTDRFINSFN